jgi:GNAT superfamily N-acetyltransferase
MAACMTIRLNTVRHVLPDGFGAIQAEAAEAGHRSMQRPADDWVRGITRFDAPGEALLAATVAGQLAGIGGITIDPAEQSALRMRRSYVRVEFRRQGIGRRLAEQLIATAAPEAVLVVNAGGDLAASFWEALGFVADRRNGHTHARAAPSR